VIDAVLREEIDQALLALGRLDSVSSLLPDTALFLHTFVRKEAPRNVRGAAGVRALLAGLGSELGDVPAGSVAELASRVGRT
jgi:hypothetical protein